MLTKKSWPRSRDEKVFVWTKVFVMVLSKKSCFIITDDLDLLFRLILDTLMGKS